MRPLKSLKSWESATILTCLRTTRTSRSARNSKGYRWISANSLPNISLPFQLNDSNYLLLCSSKKNPHQKIGTPRRSPNLIYWAPGTIYWVCPNLGTLKYNGLLIGIVRKWSSVGQNMDLWLISLNMFIFSSKLPKQLREQSNLCITKHD